MNFRDLVISVLIGQLIGLFEKVSLRDLLLRFVRLSESSVTNNTEPNE